MNRKSPNWKVKAEVLKSWAEKLLYEADDQHMQQLLRVLWEYYQLSPASTWKVLQTVATDSIGPVNPFACYFVRVAHQKWKEELTEAGRKPTSVIEEDPFFEYIASTAFYLAASPKSRASVDASLATLIESTCGADLHSCELQNVVFDFLEACNLGERKRMLDAGEFIYQWSTIASYGSQRGDKLKAHMKKAAERFMSEAWNAMILKEKGPLLRRKEEIGAMANSKMKQHALKKLDEELGHEVNFPVARLYEAYKSALFSEQRRSIFFTAILFTCTQHGTELRYEEEYEQLQVMAPLDDEWCDWIEMMQKTLTGKALKVPNYVLDWNTLDGRVLHRGAQHYFDEAFPCKNAFRTAARAGCIAREQNNEPCHINDMIEEKQEAFLTALQRFVTGEEQQQQQRRKRKADTQPEPELPSNKRQCLDEDTQAIFGEDDDNDENNLESADIPLQDSSDGDGVVDSPHRVCRRKTEQSTFRNPVRARVLDDASVDVFYAELVNVDTHPKVFVKGPFGPENEDQLEMQKWLMRVRDLIDDKSEFVASYAHNELRLHPSDGFFCGDGITPEERSRDAHEAGDERLPYFVAADLWGYDPEATVIEDDQEVIDRRVGDCEHLDIMKHLRADARTPADTCIQDAILCQLAFRYAFDIDDTTEESILVCASKNMAVSVDEMSAMRHTREKLFSVPLSEEKRAAFLEYLLDVDRRKHVLEHVADKCELMSRKLLFNTKLKPLFDEQGISEKLVRNRFDKLSDPDFWFTFL